MSEKVFTDFLEDIKLCAIELQDLKLSLDGSIDEIWEESMQKEPRQRIIRKISALRHTVSKLSNSGKQLIDKCEEVEEQFKIIKPFERSNG